MGGMAHLHGTWYRAEPPYYNTSTEQPAVSAFSATPCRDGFARSLGLRLSAAGPRAALLDHVSELMSHELRIGVWVGEEDAVSDGDRIGIPLTEERLGLLPAERHPDIPEIGSKAPLHALPVRDGRVGPRGGAVQAAREILLRSSVALPRARSDCDTRQGDLT